MEIEEQISLENEFMILILEATSAELKEIIDVLMINNYKFSDPTYKNVLLKRLYDINNKLEYKHFENIRFIKRSIYEEVAKRFVLNKL